MAETPRLSRREAYHFDLARTEGLLVCSTRCPGRTRVAYRSWCRRRVRVFAMVTLHPRYAEIYVDLEPARRTLREQAAEKVVEVLRKQYGRRWDCLSGRELIWIRRVPVEVAVCVARTVKEIAERNSELSPDWVLQFLPGPFEDRGAAKKQSEDETQ